MTAAELTEDKVAELGGLNGIVGFHIRLAHGAVYRHFTETFADLDLTQKQVSGAVAGSRKCGHVAGRARRTPAVGPRDADGHGLALADANNCIAAHEAWLKARFTPAEIEKLVEMLARIHE